MKAAAALARLFLCLAFVASGGASAFAQSEEGTAKIAELKQKAEQGDAKAQFDLGFSYWLGRDIETDYAEAKKWLRLAAEQGYAAAQYRLGSMYRYGKEGVLPNYKEAARLYRLAAEQGDLPAQYDLGSMYLNGKGVAQNYGEAYIWFALVAFTGSDIAIKKRQEAEEKLTADEVNQAQAEAAKRLEEIKKKQAAAQ